ncbi:hypothetical protein LLEC1_00564 [Akanthomyces lecanii]|uniref:Carboxylesterase type B domain-containing protein n=1 Tax=Cordyceps confragosa TaxID=2714763 RepID=A0A179I7T7_CORDF|nr:hypothetical protein LLEC1_00564 [Akanthomyces lecanii]
MQLRSSLLVAVVALIAPLALAVDSKVRLPYAQYDGLVLSNGITQWLGMRYAAPPIGPRRFRHPHDPDDEDGVQSAQAHGDLCLVTGNPVDDPGHGEDCLFINVQAPSSARKKSNLPVFVYISGDGYGNVFPDSKVNATQLLENNGMNFVVVTFNYRVGPYGFLSKGNATNTNNGIRDQVKALDWVNNFIHHFGGDRKHVVIGGSGIGAQNALILLTTLKNFNHRFAGIIAESPAFTPMLNMTQADVRYREFVQQMGCDNTTDYDLLYRSQMESSEDFSLDCMRKLSAEDIQVASRNAAVSDTKAPPWDPWLPHIDNDVIVDTISNNFRANQYAGVPFILGNIVNNSPEFAYRSGATTEDAIEYMHALYPDLLPKDLKEIGQMYPKHTVKHGQKPDISNAHQDSRYTCPALVAAEAMKHEGIDSGWLYLWQVDEWEILDAADRQHIQAAALWGRPAVGPSPERYSEGGVNEAVPSLKQRYWTNFIKSLNPNVNDKRRWAARAASRRIRLTHWGRWKTQSRARLIFKNRGKAKVEDTDHLRWSCSFWKRLSPRMHI